MNENELDDFRTWIPAHVAKRLAERPEFWSCDVHGNYPGTTEDCPACEAEARRQVEARRNQWQMRSRWIAADVPRRFRDATFDNLVRRSRELDRIATAVEAMAQPLGDPQAITLCGGVGTGKTHMAAAAIAAAVRAGDTARYVSLPELLGAIRASFNRKDGPDETEILDSVTGVDLLVLDEAGAGSRSEWEAAQLARVIDGRYGDDLGRMLVLTNARPEQLDEALGERAADRLREMGPVLLVPGKSFREEARAKPRHGVDAIPEPELHLRLVVTRRGQRTEATFGRDGREVR